MDFLLDVPLKDWQKSLSDGGIVPQYRVRQLAHWVFRQGVLDWDRMQNLPKDLRNRWSSEWQIVLPVVETCLVSKDGTRKIVFRLRDGARIESVIIPREDRATLCVSSQVGCGIGCRFCRTAEMGLVRNLSVGEIIGQVMKANQLLSDEPIRDSSPYANKRPEMLRINHIVFMGMGEPLANFETLVQSLGVLTAADGIGLSPRRITVSTSGLAGRIRDLGESGYPVNLAISLSAPTDGLRERLMPINAHHPIRAILDACRSYPLRNRQRITFEYVLLGGVNDSLAEARSLAKLLAPFRSKVNLIPFNPFGGSPFRRPLQEDVLRFQSVLLEKGVAATLRKTRGEDILGACGQLALENRFNDPEENSEWKAVAFSLPV
ncbi:MAG: 23S rRNA (adenine(2503)-C(2))-methyltransferase RlmN [Leptospirales bacterium]